MASTGGKNDRYKIVNGQKGNEREKEG